MNAILLYLLALKAKRNDLKVHGFIAMANHVHFVLTDLFGNMPDFAREFFSESGKALKVHHGTDRTIYGSSRYGSVRLLDRDAGDRFIAYTIHNPEEAGLTRAREYPGLTSAKYAFGETIVAERPQIYFSKRYRPERERIGKRLAGIARVLGMSTSLRGPKPFGHLNPRLATRDRELMRRAIECDCAFRRAHQEAKEAYIAGQTQVVFPPGTYGYRKHLGVRVARGRCAA